MSDLRLTVDVTEFKSADATIKQARRTLDNFKDAARDGSSALGLARAVRKTENDIRELVRAKRDGVIGANLYEKGLLELKRQYESLGYSSQKATAQVRRFANQAEQQAIAQTQMRTASVGNTRSMNSLGVAMQQSGYQIGDFLVQVQSGTNAFVAFGQQATQLVGILPELAKNTRISQTALIGISSALGIVIPLATALIGAYMRTREEAEDAASATETFSSAVDDYSQATENAIKSSKELSEEYGSQAEAMERLFKQQRRLAEIEARRAASDALNVGLTIEDEAVRQFVSSVDIIEANYERLFRALEEGLEPRRRDRGIGLFITQTRELAELLNLTEQGALDYAVALSQAQEAAASGDTERMANAVQNLYNTLNDALIPGAELSDQMVEYLNKLNEGEITLREFIDLQETNADTISDSADEANRLADAFLRAANNAINMQRALNSLSTPFESAMEELEFEVSLAGMGEAEKLVATRVRRLRERMESESEQVFGFDYGLTKQQQQQLAQFESALRENVSALISDTSGGGGGGGSDVMTLTEAQRAIDEMTASYNEQAAIALKVADAKAKINEITSLYPGLEDEANRALQGYIESLRESDSVMDKFVNDSAAQMSDAFMSIIDGSKSASDAFSNMAQAILRQAVELAVINPIMNNLFGGFGGFNPLPTLFNANGNAFENGKVTPFADGGVVNSPTIFPMANGAGLMGEAGPEAIMPLKRNAQGKLGVEASGQQPVTVENHFHISANGDESVKRIISQEAPKIAQLTQRQILDQRSRGGAFKKTFG
mgnify:CR=1 FL=1